MTGPVYVLSPTATAVLAVLVDATEPLTANAIAARLPTRLCPVPVPTLDRGRTVSSGSLLGPTLRALTYRGLVGRSAGSPPLFTITDNGRQIRG